jgi:hypothetical protein
LSHIEVEHDARVFAAGTAKTRLPEIAIAVEDYAEDRTGSLVPPLFPERTDLANRWASLRHRDGNLERVGSSTEIKLEGRKSAWSPLGQRPGPGAILEREAG